MAHAPGWTLAVLRCIFAIDTDTRVQEVVLTYDCGAMAVTGVNARNLAGTLQANLGASGILDLLHAAQRFQTVGCFLDDGTNQIADYSAVAGVGTYVGDVMPPNVGIIIRKRAPGRGRRRFAHNLWPALPADALTDNGRHYAELYAVQWATVVENCLTLAAVGGFAAKMVIYHRDIDTRSVIDSVVEDRIPRSNRHRYVDRGS